VYSRFKIFGDKMLCPWVKFVIVDLHVFSNSEFDAMIHTRTNKLG